MNDLRQGDCLELMKEISDSSVDCILTDPPYYRVKNEPWDRQWDDPAKFLEWMELLVEQWHRILKPNGSLYVFASPKMAARVECEIGRRFSILNHIVWPKSDMPTSALKYGDDRFRQYVQKSERIIFAEHYGADSIAKGEKMYGAKCDEARGFIFEPLRKYLADEWGRAGLTKKDADAATGSQMAGHYLTSIQWSLPTREKYGQLRAYANKSGGDYLKREYDDLKREYDDLKREYDDLQAQFQELRRPFSVSADVPFTDVWEFKTVSHYKGKHPCEKPADLLEHIIKVSTRDGATVLDCFMGAGSTGVACRNLNRNFIGIEKDEIYFKIAQERINLSPSRM